MVGDDRARFQVHVRAEDAIADEVEMRGCRAGEQKRGFQLDAGPGDAIRFQPASAAQVGTGRHEAARPDDRRGLHRRAGLHDRLRVDRDAVCDPIGPVEGGDAPGDQSRRPGRDLPGAQGELAQPGCGVTRDEVTQTR